MIADGLRTYRMRKQSAVQRGRRLRAAWSFMTAIGGAFMVIEGVPASAAAARRVRPA
jgi:hypothetical protein